MVWLWGSENISMMLLNAALLALWPVLPVLIVCYIRQSLIARRMRPTFALRKSETDELDRAHRLFGRICERVKWVSQKAKPKRGFRRFFGARSPDSAAARDDEIEDLHAQHLQATIRRLTNLPLKRLGHWIHVRSSRFACGVAVAAYVAASALLLALLFEKSAWAEQLIMGANSGAWYPFDEKIFQVNAVATGCACMAAPLFYFVRRFSGPTALNFSSSPSLQGTGQPKRAISRNPSSTAVTQQMQRTRESSTKTRTGSRSWVFQHKQQSTRSSTLIRI